MFASDIRNKLDVNKLGDPNPLSLISFNVVIALYYKFNSLTLKKFTRAFKSSSSHAIANTQSFKINCHQHQNHRSQSHVDHINISSVSK